MMCSKDFKDSSGRDLNEQVGDTSQNGTEVINTGCDQGTK